MSKKNRPRDEFYSFFSKGDDSGKESRTTFRPRKKSIVPKILLLAFLILLGTSAWYGYGFFAPRVAQGNDSLSVDITGPASASLGTLTDYQVVVKNNGNLDFSHGDLFLEYPKTLAILQTDPEAQNTKKNFWNLGALAKGSTETIHIRGIFSGAADQGDVTMNVSLQYENPVYHSSFVIKKSLTSHIEQAKQDLLSIEGPQSIRPNDHVSYTIHYQDIRTIPNSDSVHLKIQIPQSIHIDQRKPEASDAKNNDWNGKTLQDTMQSDAQSGTIQLDGTADQTVPDTQSITAQLFFTNSDGTDTLLAEKTYDVAVAHGDLSLSLRVHDVPNGPLKFDGAIPCTLVFENKGGKTLKNTEIALSSDSPLINWDGSDGTEAKKEATSIHWTKDSHKELASIAPHAQGSLSFSLALKDPSTLASTILHPGTGSLGATFQLQGTSESAQDEQGNSSQDGLISQIPPVTLRVLSDTHMSAFVRRIVSTDGTQSIVRVNLALTNTLNDISDIQIKAHLGTIGDWSGQTTRSAGDVSYDSDKKEVTWTLNKMPSSVHRIDASFDLSVPKDFNDATAIIIDSITLGAKDSVVHAPLTQTLSNLTMLKGND